MNKNVWTFFDYFILLFQKNMAEHSQQYQYKGSLYGIIGNTQSESTGWGWLYLSGKYISIIIEQ